MCNLYSLTKGQQAIRQLAEAMTDQTGNLPPLPGVFPDYPAPIVRNHPGSRELTMARWGMPTPPWALLKGKPQGTDPRTVRDPGTTNIRNTKFGWWRQWFGIEHRCVVPFTSFSEPEPRPLADGKRPSVWFALDDSRPLAFFAGVWTNWTAVRKVKEGEVTTDIFAFLTTEPNKEVAEIHRESMPVILTSPEEIDTWLTASAEEALKLQRPLPDGSLRIVAGGEKEDLGSLLL
jgi:putative SOS response-associated peptidase YedK